MAEDAAPIPGADKAGLSKIVIAAVILIGLIGLVEVVAFVTQLIGIGLEKEIAIPVRGASGDGIKPFSRSYLNSLLLGGPGFIILCWYIGRNLLRSIRHIRMIAISFSVIFFAHRALLVGQLREALSLPAWLDTWVLLEMIEICLFIPLLVLVFMSEINRGSESEVLSENSR
jgi:hypothetical protein